MTKDPPAALDEPDTDCEVIEKLRAQITDMDLDRTHNARELERLQEAKRRALAIADERSKENCALRQLLRDARDHVPWDVLKRIDAALAVKQT